MARCWLMKSEPDVYSIEDLEPDGTICRAGVRNYRARNLMGEMEVGEGPEGMVVTKRSRLSVQPVRPDEYDVVLRLGGAV